MPAPRAVCLSPIPWGGLWTSRHEICSELARRGWDVLFVDPPSNAARARVGSPTYRPVPPDGLRVASPPPYLPFGVLGPVRGVASAVIGRNAARYASCVAGTARAWRPDGRVDLLLNSFMPVMGFRVQGALEPRVSVYHRSDELAQFPGWRPAYRELEEQVAVAADAVVCVSAAVREGIRRVRPDAVVIPNGVDTARFDSTVPPDPRLSGLERPVSVMVGVFDRRVDPRLLEAAASCSSLVLVGRVGGVDVPEGATRLGHVEPGRIPGILAAADVGLVCYKAGWAGDVLKIYEYLAAGLPVVTSHRPDVPGVGDAVTVAADPGDFARHIRRECAGRTGDGDAARRRVAAANSWARRVDDLLQLTGLAAAPAVP